MESPERSAICTPVARPVGSDLTSEQVATASSAVWSAVCAHLNPILGPRGVAAIYRRSLLLNRPAHPPLGSVPDSPEGIDLPALAGALSDCSPHEALAASDALLLTFHQLLITLIGASLTDRLLRSVRPPPSGAPLDQDTSP